MKGALLAVLLLAAAGAARAAGPAPAYKPEPRLKFFAEYQYYLPADAGAGLQDQLHAQAGELLASGYSSADKSVINSGGSGARLGFLYGFKPGTGLGLSLDYVLGPTMNAELNATSAAKGDGGLTVNRAVSYYRLLAHTQVNLLQPHTGRPGEWNLDFDSAFGLGVGHVDQTCEASGSVACPFGNSPRSWAGFAWEFGPRLTYRLRFVDLTGSVRYAGFPRFHGSDEIPEIRWQAVGFSLGASF